MEIQTRVFGKSVAGDVYSMTLGIRVCLLFQKVSLQNRSYLFKKKTIVVKSRKNYSAIIFSALNSCFFFTFLSFHRIGLLICFQTLFEDIC